MNMQFSFGAKIVQRLGAALVPAAALLPARQASAQNGLITIDENGNGTLTQPGGAVFALPATMLPDPGLGGLPSVLNHNMLNPPGLVFGDVLLQEGPGGPIQDVIRLSPVRGGLIFFYSDNTDGSDSLADTSRPPQFDPHRVIIQEIGPEGNNGAIYTPGPNDPGFIAGAAFGVTYNIMSDVPAPGTGTLLGLAGLVALRRRR